MTETKKKKINLYLIKLFALLIGSSMATSYEAISKDIPRNDKAPKAISFNRSQYKPAIIRLSLSQQTENKNLSLDTILIPNEGNPLGSRITFDKEKFSKLIDLLYNETSEALSIDILQDSSPSRQLYKMIFGKIENHLRSKKITTLLISLDPELQKIPFSALHDGNKWLAEIYAYSITPSISLMPRGDHQYPAKKEYLLAGSTVFREMSPLIFVKQELDQIANLSGGEIIINEQFTENELEKRAGEKNIHRLHLATHGEFIPGNPEESKLYLSNGSISMNKLRELRVSRSDWPLELLSLSACRTALGDSANELGLAGLALLAGAQSAIGTLWYVDDIAASIFFIRFYHWLEKGLPKAEAVQQVRFEFIHNKYQLKNSKLISPEGNILIDNLSIKHQIQLREGLDHPYFWAAPVLIGKPW